MLVALNSQNKKVLASRELENTRDFKCIHCKGKVILKKGNIKIPHFSHVEKCTCSYSDYIKEKCGGESELHYKWKLHIKEQMEKLDYVERVDLEVRIGNRIADIVVHINDDDRDFDKFIVEVQLSKINIDTVVNRSNDYIAQGYEDYSIFWLFGKKNLSLALKSHSGILEDVFKIGSREFLKDSVTLANVIDKDIEEEDYDAFYDHVQSFCGFKLYIEMLEIKNKIRISKRFIKDLTNDRLEIMELVNAIAEGRILRKLYNECIESTLFIESRPNKTRYDILRLEKLNKKMNTAKTKLFKAIEDYKELRDIYLKKYNIDNTYLTDIINEVINVRESYGMRKKISEYYLKEEYVYNWILLESDEITKDTEELNYVFELAKHIYELELEDVCSNKSI